MMAELQALEDLKLDGYLTVTDEEAVHSCKLLAQREGIFAGFSAVT